MVNMNCMFSLNCEGFSNDFLENNHFKTKANASPSSEPR